MINIIYSKSQFIVAFQRYNYAKYHRFFRILNVHKIECNLPFQLQTHVPPSPTELTINLSGL